jgi:hypothetical protein
MDRSQAQAFIRKMREEIRRRESEAPSGGLPHLSSGFPPLDALLPGGGFPAGRITELTGTIASGKTTLALLALARATRSGKLAAFVDPTNELYPPAALALGAELSRLLIVRPPDPSLCLRVAGMLARSGTFAGLAVDLDPAPGLHPAGTPAWSKGVGAAGGRRLLEAAEAGRAAIILLSKEPSSLDVTLRISVERSGEEELLLVLERSRMGPPGKTSRGMLQRGNP